jgi:hypothetical protein
MKMGAECISETFVPISKTIWRHVAEDYIQYMPTHRHKKREFHFRRVSFSPSIRKKQTRVTPVGLYASTGHN